MRNSINPNTTTEENNQNPSTLFTVLENRFKPSLKIRPQQKLKTRTEPRATKADIGPIAQDKQFSWAQIITNSTSASNCVVCRAHPHSNDLSILHSAPSNVKALRLEMSPLHAGTEFMESPSLTAQITGIDATLIQRLAVILEIISCSANIDSSKFGVYTADTTKDLVRGAEIIECATLPADILSEEAQEYRNQDYPFIAHLRPDPPQQNLLSQEAIDLLV
ncbi:hypothetical protein ILUMI_27338 [Ignelater luminosus]|uniref:Uncharacterized protein n=1 Tax=Ignelater luminosus TaxID=2038154 RepID=A0A8K0C381_IGNLU|nr:hypothetical protein ILUMI_27338 [Ignelater luminosus]